VPCTHDGFSVLSGAHFDNATTRLQFAQRVELERESALYEDDGKGRLAQCARHARVNEDGERKGRRQVAQNNARDEHACAHEQVVDDAPNKGGSLTSVPRAPSEVASTRTA